MSEPNIAISPPDDDDGTSRSSTSSTYFKLSDIPGSLISTVLLREDNYAEWSINIRYLLQEKQKIGFIDGSIPKPLTNPDLTLWLATNSIIVGWILKAIDPKIRSTVAFANDSWRLWESLRRRFSVGNGVRVHELKAMIRSCRQEGQSVKDYFGRLSKLWEELQSYKSTRDCSCHAAKYIEKEKEDERVHQFLMGLHRSGFSSIRFSIVRQDPLPDLNQVYSLVITEEQRFQAAKLKELKLEPVQQHVQAAKSKEHNLQPVKQHVQAAKSKELKPEPEQVQLHHVRPQRKDMSCSHCGRRRHQAETCYVLHGYPESWHERQKNKPPKGRVRIRHGTRAASSGKSINTQERVNVSQTATTNQSLSGLNMDKFNTSMNLRTMQHPESNICYGGPSDLDRFPMAQKLEPKGGNGGKEWDDGDDYEGVSQIYIREGCGGIESIKFDYVKNGQPKDGPIHGGSGQSFTEWFDLNHTCDEHIVSVTCFFEEGAIQGFVIKTNIRTSALMGYNLGTTFKLEVKGKKIIGFHGSSGKNLYSLGAYFTPLSPGNLKY
ncbi:Jacalin-like lectin domain [Arabidopsis thaliana x Arabidopsis arenosa]|uniref:Jacalin-like lectin domain n=1 Tax=Arabidopsis thaliana x Arabidopsis arenosa TaxID=1240361 RepID=A0A8T1Z605_9BRAS|nr:Jacalin-like lectin domain [Arabidopsis thaliana x Arabidopsis arenosa]